MELLVAKTRLPTNVNTQTHEQTPFALRDSLLISRDKLWIMYPLGACDSARRAPWLKCWDRVFGGASKVKNICQWRHSDWRSVSILHRIFLAQSSGSDHQSTFFFFFADDHQAVCYSKAAWQYCFFPDLTICWRLPDVVVAAGCHHTCVVGQKHPRWVASLWQGHIERQTHTYSQRRVTGAPHVYVFVSAGGSWITRGTHADTGGGANFAQKAPGPGTRRATFILRGNGATKQYVTQSILQVKKK